MDGSGRSLVSTVDEWLGTSKDRAGLSFDLGRHLHGAFGGAFGGAVAAAALRAARDVAGDRIPVSLDARFLRSLPAGIAQARTSVLHAGRSLTTVGVDMVDADGRAAARATVGLTDPTALHPLEWPATDPPELPGYDEGKDWKSPEEVDIPILSTLRPRVLASGPAGIATGVRVPWTDPGASAEAACLAADMCVGPPVAAASPSRWIPHPNPDLSLRFVGEITGSDVVGIGRLERISAGLAGVAVGVWSDAELVAIGVSSSMLLSTG